MTYEPDDDDSASIASDDTIVNNDGTNDDDANEDKSDVTHEDTNGDTSVNMTCKDNSTLAEKGDGSNTNPNESSEPVPSQAQASASHVTMAPSENALPPEIVSKIIKMAAANGMTLQPHQVPAFYDFYCKLEKAGKI